MSWSWVQWDEDVFVSSSGHVLQVMQRKLENGLCYELELGKNGLSWFVDSRTFDTQEEARAAMIDFIARCGQLNDSSRYRPYTAEERDAFFEDHLSRPNRLWEMLKEQGFIKE